MRFLIDDEQTRKDWSKLLGREVGREVYMTHDEYMDHRSQIEEIQRESGKRKAKLIEH